MEQIIISTTKNKKTILWYHIVKIIWVIFVAKKCFRKVYQTAKYYKADIILFITGDCPIIDIKIIKSI